MRGERDDRMFSQAEGTSLPVHVAACAERYKTLFNRMGRIERIMLVTAGGVFSLLLTVAGAVLVALITKGLGV